MIVVDVPVDAGEELHVALVRGEIGIGAGVIAILFHHVVLGPLKVRNGGAGKIVVSVGDSVLGSPPAVDHGRGEHILGVHEEEQLVLHDGAAEGHAVGGLAVHSTCARNLLTIYCVSLEILVLVIYVGASLEGVGT